MSEKVTRRVKKLSDEKKAAIEQLWRLGELSWKLKGKQLDIYNHFKFNNDDVTACLISRRFGKSYTMCILAIEVCLTIPNAIVKYACPQQKMVENIIKPAIYDIIRDCPSDIKPTWLTAERKWKFPNGSEIQVAGTDNGNYDNLRGGASHLCICDESGFMDSLEDIVYSVMLPTTDTTGGKLFMCSTPNPDDPNHDFHRLFVKPLEASGKLLVYTIKDSPMVDDATREKILKRYPGGEKNIRYQCEYLCMIPNTTESSVIPEFTEAEVDIVKEVELPDYCNFFTSADVGFKDLTFIVFGYYDPHRDITVILDEYVVNGTDVKLDVLNRTVRFKEELHYETKHGKQEVTFRVMDNNLLLINELAQKYDLVFLPTQKHNKSQHIDSVRHLVDKRKLIIHPRCKNLRYHVKNAQWKLTKEGTHTGEFRRMTGNEDVGIKDSHADGLDALIYFVRNTVNQRNPYPKDYFGSEINENTHVSAKYRAKETGGSKLLKTIFNVK